MTLRSITCIGLPLLGLALLAVASSRAHASVAVALSLEELTASADEVLLVESVGERSRYDERGRIVTDVTLEVHDSMKGRHAAGEQVELTFLGGAVGDVGMRVPGEAHLPVGREAIVFTRRGADGRGRTVGMSQGVLPVVRAQGRATVHPGGHGLHLVPADPAARTARAASALTGPAPLDDVLDHIRSIVASQRGTRP
jgi:hypothetical protein